MEKIYTINEIQRIVAPIAKQHNVNRVYLFGSYARGEADENSDVDLRVDAKTIRDLFSMGALYSDLQDALNKPLDLITTEALLQQENLSFTKKFFDKIRKDEKLLYENL